MKIYSRIVSDILTGEILESDSFEYSGAVALCGDAGIGTMPDIALDDGAAEVAEEATVPGAESEGTELPVETPEGPPEGEAQPVEGEQEAEEPEEAEEPKPMLPRELTKAIRTMREAHPEHAQALRELQRKYFVADAHTKIFKSPEDALAARSTIEMLGGDQGIAELRGWKRVVQDIDKRVDLGDPSVVDDMARSSPDGFKKIIPHALQTLATMDRIAYMETMRPLVLQDLKGSGFKDYLDAAAQELGAGETERANRYLKAMQQFIADAERQEEEKKNRYKDPRLEEIETREKRLREESANQLVNTVASDLASYRRQTIARAVAPLARERKLSNDARDHIIESVNQQILRSLGSNDFYKENMINLIGEGDREKATKYGKDQIDRMRQATVNSVWSKIYGSIAPPRRKPIQAVNGTQAQSQGVSVQPRGIPVQERPSWRDVDMSKTSQEMFLDGKAYLKNGKYVTWRRS